MKQLINIGIKPNSKTGDSLRTAFSKINANFTDIYEKLTRLLGSTDTQEFIDLNIRGTVSSLDGTVLLNGQTGVLSLSALPQTTGLSLQFIVQFDSAGTIISVSNLPDGVEVTRNDFKLLVKHPLTKHPVLITSWWAKPTGELEFVFLNKVRLISSATTREYELEVDLSGNTTNSPVTYALINLVF